MGRIKLSRRAAIVALSVLMMLLTGGGLQGAQLAYGPEYSGDGDEGESLLPVKVFNKWGYIDIGGRIVIEPVYRGADYFKDGLAIVTMGNLRRALINIQNEIICEEDDFYRFEGQISQGFLGFMDWDKGRGGYINAADGSMAISPRYDRVMNFSEGLAPVARYFPPLLPWETHQSGDGRSEVWGFINRAGKSVVKHKYDTVYLNGFSEGLQVVGLNGRFGYIDRSGREVIKTRYQLAQDFHEGLAVVMNDDRWGYIDKTGKVALKLQYECAGDFSEGLAPVQSGEKWGFIDKRGSVIIPYQFSNAQTSRFSGGIAVVRDSQSNKFGCIDKKGAWVILPISDSLIFLHQGVAIVTLEGLQGLMDMAGKWIVRPQFKNIEAAGNGFFQVSPNADQWQVGMSADAEVGYMDRNGKVIWEPQW